MTPNQIKTEYEGGRLARQMNFPVSNAIGPFTLLIYRRDPECKAIDPQIKNYLDGWFDQDAELAMEVS
jgi:hypothetical protein